MLYPEDGPSLTPDNTAEEYQLILQEYRFGCKTDNDSASDEDPKVSFADKDVILWDSEVLVRRRDELLESEHAFSPEQKLQLPIHPKGACDTLFLLMCLKAHALTSHLDDMGLNIMVDAMDEVWIKEGTVLRKEGEHSGPKHQFYVIMEGECQYMQDKRQMKLLGVGDAVGGQGMVAPGVYASTIRAVSDVRAYRLPVKVYKQLLVYLRQKKQEQAMACLAHLSFAKYLTQTDILCLVEAMHSKRFSPNEYIMKAGEPVSALYITVQGTVQRSPASPTRDRALTIAPFGLIGEHEFVSGGLSESSYQCLSEVRVVKLERQTLELMVGDIEDWLREMKCSSRRVSEHEQLKGQGQSLSKTMSCGISNIPQGLLDSTSNHIRTDGSSGKIKARSGSLGSSRSNSARSWNDSLSKTDGGASLCRSHSKHPSSPTKPTKSPTKRMSKVSFCFVEQPQPLATLSDPASHTGSPQRDRACDTSIPLNGPCARDNAMPLNAPSPGHPRIEELKRAPPGHYPDCPPAAQPSAFCADKGWAASPPASPLQLPHSQVLTLAPPPSASPLLTPQMSSQSASPLLTPQSPLVTVPPLQIPFLAAPSSQAPQEPEPEVASVVASLQVAMSACIQSAYMVGRLRPTQQPRSAPGSPIQPLAALQPQPSADSAPDSVKSMLPARQSSEPLWASFSTRTPVGPAYPSAGAHPLCGTSDRVPAPHDAPPLPTQSGDTRSNPDPPMRTGHTGHAVATPSGAVDPGGPFRGQSGAQKGTRCPDPPLVLDEFSTGSRGSSSGSGHGPAGNAAGYMPLRRPTLPSVQTAPDEWGVVPFTPQPQTVPASTEKSECPSIFTKRASERRPTRFSAAKHWPELESTEPVRNTAALSEPQDRGPARGPMGLPLRMGGGPEADAASPVVCSSAEIADAMRALVASGVIPPTGSGSCFPLFGESNGSAAKNKPVQVVRDWLATQNGFRC